MNDDEHSEELDHLSDCAINSKPFIQSENCDCGASKFRELGYKIIYFKREEKDAR